MASRLYIRRSHEKRRPSLQPDTFVPPNKSGSTSNAGNDTASSLHHPTVSEINRKSFPMGVLDTNGSGGSTPTSGCSGRSSSAGNYSDTPLMGTKKLKATNTITLGLISYRFSIFCVCLTAIFMAVVFLSLYRLLT